MNADGKRKKKYLYDENAPITKYAKEKFKKSLKRPEVNKKVHFKNILV